LGNINLWRCTVLQQERQPDTIALIAQRITTWVSLWQRKRGVAPVALAPLSRIDVSIAVRIALKHIMLGGLMRGKAKVTGLAVAIGRAVAREIGGDSEGPWGAEVYFRVGMELLNAIVEVTGRYEFKRHPARALKCWVIAPRAGGEAWLLAQLEGRTITHVGEECRTAMPQSQRRKMMSARLSGRGRVTLGLTV
jgi:hypothetical protein